MEPLFDFEPTIDRHITGIITQMLKALSNNNPKKDSKCYLRCVKYVSELYEGTFLLNKKFDMSRDRQFDMTDVFAKINQCKHDWGKVREIVLGSLKHLEEAKKPEKMPWNKSYLNSITFSRFFSNGYSQDGLVDCPFVHLVNPPKDSYAYTSDITIRKLKDDTLALIREPAERFCKKYFKIKSYQLSFWYDMEDWSRWLRNLKGNFPGIYNEFIMGCEDGNPFADFQKYLLSVLRQKEGDHPVMNHWYFKLTYNDGVMLDGYFRQWLRSGMDRGRFGAFRQLPKSIDSYYTDESFRKKAVAEKKKEVVEMEDIVW